MESPNNDNQVNNYFESLCYELIRTIIPYSSLGHESIWINILESFLSRELIWIKILEAFLSLKSIWIKYQKSILSRELIWINYCKVIVSHKLSRIKTFWDWVESNHFFSHTHVWPYMIIPVGSTRAALFMRFSPETRKHFWALRRELLRWNSHKLGSLILKTNTAQTRMTGNASACVMQCKQLLIKSNVCADIPT